MAKIISLFNHKGGVSKTTTTFHLGWTMAEMGLKVLMVDADPQCNLTGTSVKAFKDDEEDAEGIISSFYKRESNKDIYSSLEKIFTGEDIQITGINPTKTLKDGLDIIIGNIRLSETDIHLAIGMISNKYVSPYAKQFIGAMNAQIRKTAENRSYDIVLIDLSPSVGLLNQTILMSSDYFIVPTSPDYYCYQAIKSLSRLIPSWSEDFKFFKDPTKVKNPLPKDNPKFLGILSQRYRPYKTKTKKKETTKAYQMWIDKIKQQVKNELVEKLNDKGMIIDEHIFKENVKDDTPYNLISISDFNTLMPKSQDFCKPVFELSTTELRNAGTALAQNKKKQKEFKDKFNQLSISILGMIGLKDKIPSLPANGHPN